MRITARGLRAIAKYGERYSEELLIARHDTDRLRTDWWAGLRFWFDRAFYQGRRNALSERIEARAVNALEEVVGEDSSKRADAVRELAAGGWLQPENWEAGANPVQGALVRHQVNKRYDRLMVLGTLALCAEVNHLNIVLWAVETIRRGAVDAAFKRLDDIPSVGPKIASLFLRDIVDLFALHPHVQGEARRLLQPIDVWVERVARAAGLSEVRPEDLPAAIVAACDQANVDPIRFNQGAWYIGFHAFDVALELLGKA